MSGHDCVRGGGLEVLGLDAHLVVGVRLQPSQAVPAIEFQGRLGFLGFLRFL